MSEIHPVPMELWSRAQLDSHWQRMSARSLSLIGLPGQQEAAVEAARAYRFMKVLELAAPERGEA